VYSKPVFWLLLLGAQQQRWLSMAVLDGACCCSSLFLLAWRIPYLGGQALAAAAGAGASGAPCSAGHQFLMLLRMLQLQQQVVGQVGF
jgi:hypothetical protein